jgi:hypothetical protein
MALVGASQLLVSATDSVASDEKSRCVVDKPTGMTAVKCV